MLDQLLINEDADEDQRSLGIEIKKEICDLLIFLLNKRQDFLISNAIAWFKRYETKL